MVCNTCLFVNVSSVSGRIKNIGSLRGHIYSPDLPCLVSPPCQPTCLVSLPALSACLPACLVSLLPALSACLPALSTCLPALSARLPCQPACLVSPPALFWFSSFCLLLLKLIAN
jgi:hypothetical protein